MSYRVTFDNSSISCTVVTNKEYRKNENERQWTIYNEHKGKFRNNYYKSFYSGLLILMVDFLSAKLRKMPIQTE